jgi:hypothetical protein
MAEEEEEAVHARERENHHLSQSNDPLKERQTATFAAKKKDLLK